MSEYLLRCRASDYYTKVRFHRELNFNIIRNWMGMTPDEAFYNACDVRMYATERATRYGYSLYEFEVYGPNDPNPN